MKPTPPPDSMGFSLDLAEPYIEEDGNYAVALIWNASHINLKTIREWKEEQPNLGKYLEARYFPTKLQRWRYPSRPILPTSYDDIRQLHIDIQRCNDEYIEFPNSAWPSVFATWIMGSYLVSFLPRSPVLQIYGPSGSGKGQVADQVEHLAYRGKKIIDPTPPVLFRLANEWQMTFALDELQDKNSDSFRAAMSTIKGSFDGTPVARCNHNTGEVEEFQTRAFILISLKDKHPREDIKNRGILFTMRQNGKPKNLVPRDDTPEHTNIRARLMGLRLKALTENDFIEEASKKVQIFGRPENLGFDRRPRDIAMSLLLPAIMSRQEDELIETIRKSSIEAQDENNTTFVARVQHVFEAMIGESNNPPPYLSILAIRDRLQDELKADGELNDYQLLSTRKVTDAIKTLGYDIVRKTNNSPFIDRETRQNIAAYRTNLQKFAPPGSDSGAK